jgi:hypothetical protein
MSDDIRDQIHSNLNLKETDELIDIWQTNDRVEWSELAFDIIQQILQQRLGELPPQNEPILGHGGETPPENNLSVEEMNIQALKEKRDLDGLVGVIENENNPMICLDAAESLATLGDQRGIDYLINAVKIPDTDVSDAAKEILERINDPRGNQALATKEIIINGPVSTSERLNEKYPFLTGWIGFIALFTLAGLLINFIPIPSVLQLLIEGVVGFYLFKFVIEKNILPYVNRNKKS